MNATRSFGNHSRRALLVAALALSGAGGCVRQANTAADRLDPTPIKTDPAMQLRDSWETSRAEYAATGTTAQPTGFLYTSRKDQPYFMYAASETPVFLLNTVLMPVAFIMTPPWKTVEYRAATVEPTYGGNPVLPPRMQSSSDENAPAGGSLETAPVPMTDMKPTVPMTMPSDRPGDRPLDQAPNTLPRPTSGPLIEPGGAGKPTPEPAVPAAPARHIGAGGTPSGLPTTKKITPTTNPMHAY